MDKSFNVCYKEKAYDQWMTGCKMENGDLRLYDLAK